MDNTINVSIQNVYDGPMDLLLNLIKKEKIDIYDIPISHITEEYLNTMGQINYINIESFLEFSDMAATLLQIKSRLLLPILNEDEEEEDPRESLINRLIEYNYFKYISEIFLSYYAIGSTRLIKKSEDLTILSFEEDIDYKDIDKGKLKKTFLSLIKKDTNETLVLEFDIEEELITVEEGIAFLKEKLESSKNFVFESLFSKNTSRIEIVTYFLAILELTKNGKIFLDQQNGREILIAKV